MPKRIVLPYLISCALFIGCGDSPVNLTQAEENPTVAVKPVKAPGFDLVDLKGNHVSLAKLKGRVVFLDFWATWCPPCVMSSPEVEKLVQSYKSKKVTVLSISLDDEETPVRAFVEKHGTSNTVALARNSGVDVQYRIRGIPAFFIINKEGQLVKAWEGYNPVMPSLWRKEIDSLLAS